MEGRMGGLGQSLGTKSDVNKGMQKMTLSTESPQED